MKILFIDTETGGLNPQEHSLLSVGMAVLEGSDVVDQMEVLIRHDNYRCDVEALKVNKIDLTEHSLLGKSPADALDLIDAFLKKNFVGKIIVGGHNTAFDVAFLKQLYLSLNRTLPNFDYRLLDTACILRYLYHADVLPEDLSSSNKAFDFYGIEVNGRHTALGDVLATASLYVFLLEEVT